jgi:hypothetical protein
LLVGQLLQHLAHLCTECRLPFGRGPVLGH